MTNPPRHIFRQVAAGGFGDGLNSYAHSMAWFGEHLYVGVTRANLAMLKVHQPPTLIVWPVRTPPDLYDQDMRAQIWRYQPANGKWKRVFISPWAKPGIPRDVGYRGMTVFQGPHDSAPALYVCTWSPSRAGIPPVLMRSINGTEFVTVSQLGNDPNLNTYRILFAFRDRLLTSPTGRTRGSQNASNCALVLENLDPGVEPWRPASHLAFGDPANVTIVEMAALGEFLYVGTFNPLNGFQIWKGQPDQRGWTWWKVLDCGAYRGPLNELALSMCAFDGALYIGTGIQNGGYDRQFNVGPAAAELIRVNADDSWDLIIGESRMTPDGFKHPLGGMGPGFDEFFNAYIWRMAVHDGWLYVGTYKWGAFLPYLPQEIWPEALASAVRSAGLEKITKDHGGFDLWRTRNGIEWFATTLDGFGNLYNLGVRTLASSPWGLFVGTANPFGPEIAAMIPDGWTYVPNSKGGLEVWLGRAEETPIAPGIGKSAELPVIVHALADHYDERMRDSLSEEFYQRSGFFNFGYWGLGAANPKEACETLIEELLKPTEKSRRVLDVACGSGATCKYLMRYFEPANIYGINISERQLQACRDTAPHSNFALMNATALDFPDRYFQNVICVEAAFHFDTRDDFLREAFRVLEPGGHLVLSDILFNYSNAILYGPQHLRENFVFSFAEYQSHYLEAGFTEALVRDATEECAGGFINYMTSFLQEKFTCGQIDLDALIQRRQRLEVLATAISNYIIVSAQKPGN